MHMDVLDVDIPEACWDFNILLWSEWMRMFWSVWYIIAMFTILKISSLYDMCMQVSLCEFDRYLMRFHTEFVFYFVTFNYLSQKIVQIPWKLTLLRPYFIYNLIQPMQLQIMQSRALQNHAKTLINNKIHEIKDIS